ELLPITIHFRLRLAVHDKRDGLGEFEDRTAVERHEFLSLKLEFNGHDRSRRSSGDLFSRFVITGSFPDFGILENGGVKLHGRLGLVIEPQEWDDLLHGFSPFKLSPDKRRVDRTFRSSPASCLRARSQTSSAPRPSDSVATTGW